MITLSKGLIRFISTRPGAMCFFVLCWIIAVPIACVRIIFNGLWESFREILKLLSTWNSCSVSDIQGWAYEVLHPEIASREQDERMLGGTKAAKRRKQNDL